jgi:glycosyltransferase involved in cell wall biosynthesis
MFADGEHVGIPLVAFLALRRKRRGISVVMLGHYVTRKWKRALFSVARRAFPDAHVLVHSVVQRDELRSVVSGPWRVDAVPYQVDTEFWTTASRDLHPEPLIVAVGSEGRDYDCLAEAAAGVEGRFVIAAGSHWARRTAEASQLPPNVEYLGKPLSFEDLRELYRRATVLVMPLLELENQSGVTAILEAMSMGLPVIVSANKGQQELVAGPIVNADGTVSQETAGRGPWVLEGQRPDNPRANGLYVPVGNPAALRAAIDLILSDPQRGISMGQAGREYAVRYFALERYTERLAKSLCPRDAA